MRDITKGFIQLSKAWYGKQTKDDEVTFGYYYKDGSTAGEMLMQWKNGYAELICTQEGFQLLVLFPELYEALGETRALTPNDFCDILLEIGFKNLTPHEKAL